MITALYTTGHPDCPVGVKSWFESKAGPSSSSFFTSVNDLICNILILQAHLWHKHQGSKFSVTLNSGDQSACSFRAIFLQEIEQVSIAAIFLRNEKLAQ